MKLIHFLILATFIISGFSSPTMIEIDGIMFTVDHSGIPPVDEYSIAKFVDGVFIAHNTLAGKYFTDRATIHYADGQVKEYQAIETIILQAIDPYDPATKYTDGTYVYTSDDIHYRIFTKGDVTFATCYDFNGQVGWGRKFIVMKEVLNGR